MRTLAFSGAGLTAMALVLALAPVHHASASTQETIEQLRRQMEEMQRRLEELEAKQEQTQQEVPETREKAVITKGTTPGSFVIPGSDTEVEISGYVKGDFIFDFNESTGDIFIPESITTSDSGDEERFRAHARQSRLRVKTATPTDWGPLKTHFEGDFFGSGGNEIFSNSTSFRIRHAYGQLGGILAGQTWSNFMPLTAYPTTVDFNGPAGIPFIRQGQLRYTHQLDQRTSIAFSLENSEFSGRSAATGAAFSESTNLGIRAGLDQAPDVTAAIRHQGDGYFAMLSGLGRYLGSPFDAGDGDFGWGVNANGTLDLWPGGKVLGQFTYGEGVGRYILNGFGQDAFVDANGNVDPIEAFGVTAQVQQQLTDELMAAVAYGRADFMDKALPSSLDHVNTIHGSLFWSPHERITFGAELIWGDRQDADGSRDDAFRVQTAVQVNF